MKISNLTKKTAIEIEPSDLLVIEDKEATKSISIGEFQKYLATKGLVNEMKLLINQTLDRIKDSLEDAKFPIKEERNYIMATWIGSTSGNIQIALKEKETGHWLTSKELYELLEPVEDEEGFCSTKYTYQIEILIADAYKKSNYYTILDFNEEHDKPDLVNPTLSYHNAGFIKANFKDLTQNEIAGITYEDIKLTLPETLEYIFSFVGEEESFANAVHYIDTI